MSLISDSEGRTLIMALAAGHGRSGFNEAQAEVVLDWAHKTRVDGMMLELVLSGQMMLLVEPGKSEPSFQTKPETA